MKTRVQGCRIRLLGGWSLTTEGGFARVGLREERVAALLALRGPQSRGAVASSLWPDSSEPRARANLRTAMMRLRHLDCDVVSADSQGLVLSPGVTVDVWELNRCLNTIESATGGNGWFSPEFLSLLRGPDLLPGWYEDWVLFERERLHLRRIHAMEDVGRILLAEGNAPLAIRFAEEALLLEPLLESTTRLLIESHLLAGNRSSAVRAYQAYRHRLDQELGISPSRTMRDLLMSPQGG